MSTKKSAPKYPTKREAELRKLIGEDMHKRIASLVKNKAQKDNAIRTRVDPHLKHNSHNLLIGKLFFTEFPEKGEDYMALASYLIYHIKNDNVSDLKKMFADIVTEKETADKTRGKKPSKAAIQTQALESFKKIQKDDSWTAIDFDRYLLEQTKDMDGVSFPPLYPRANWSRINKMLLIDHRVGRTGKKKVPKGKGKTT
ncbi:MAG: hypothetical protein NTW21_16555 [Verrucomicrobia bacterium]|nr:hypothetical protein [Verrucomicrobiota bacterium]